MTIILCGRFCEDLLLGLLDRGMQSEVLQVGVGRHNLFCA